jgi:hypothetical protein
MLAKLAFVVTQIKKNGIRGEHLTFVTHIPYWLRGGKK